MNPTEAALALMPMHLRIASDGRILSAGATLRRIIGEVDDFAAAFRPWSASDSPHGDERVFLHLIGAGAGLSLRGRAMRADDGSTVFNLGFGIGMIAAIRRFGLTDRDFSPAELAMELLFLHEANGALTDELARANRTLEAARSRAEAQAFTDPLTGLQNRRGLELAFAALRAGAMQVPCRPFAVAVLDLDHFKALNDQRGHAAGDAMLREVARRLGAVTRDEDTVARSGGDEFILLFPGMDDPARLSRLGARIVAAIERPFEIEGVSCRVSASLGISISTDHPAPDLAAMQAEADRALYAAKRGGRGTARLACRSGDRGQE